LPKNFREPPTNFGKANSTTELQLIGFELEVDMIKTATEPRLTSFAPQFLVDDLDRSIPFYEKLGFKFGETWEGFYAIRGADRPRPR